MNKFLCSSKRQFQEEFVTDDDVQAVFVTAKQPQNTLI